MSVGGPTPAGDQARVTVFVAVDPQTAFAIFTEEIDQWWRRGPKYRIGGRKGGIVHLEPGVGGRLFESFEAGTETKVIETGRITAWEPPARLAFEWRAVNFSPAEKTFVEVEFEPTPTGTLVTVTHRGWSDLRSDHPARHGLEGAAFVRMMGQWWGDLMSSLRQHTAGRAVDQDRLSPGW